MEELEKGEMKKIIHFFFLLLIFSVPLHAAEGPASGIASAIKRSGQPLPRWASLRGEEVNMRAGPGTRYPVLWVYRRKALPVEITAEFDTWRRVKDSEGAEGWVHLVNLSGKRSFLVAGKSTQPLFRSSDEKADLRAEAEAGVQGRLVRCRAAWCRVEIDGIKGYMRRDSIWGVYPDEKVD
jgi:SH3-like domain-containing protein